MYFHGADEKGEHTLHHETKQLFIQRKTARQKWNNLEMWEKESRDETWAGRAQERREKLKSHRNEDKIERGTKVKRLKKHSNGHLV